jgi:mannose-6-phosphate isomerase-like protein (cupin superfamily)
MLRARPPDEGVRGHMESVPGDIFFSATFADGNHPNVMQKINIAEKFSRISEYYKPHIAAELNGQMIKLVKANTEFLWHHHDNEDEMFLVVKGRFRMEYKDEGGRERREWIEAGEFIVVPRGVEHRPVAEEEVWIVLFEPASTRNTGNVVNERTVAHLQRV